MEAGARTATTQREVRKLMSPRVEQVDPELVEAIARRVADLIGNAPPADDLRRRLGEPRADRRVDPQDEMLTPDEAAPVMRHSAKSVRKLCRLPQGDPRHLRHLRKGPKILIRRADIADWIARQIGDD
jgi:Helix-turn-helix domain